MPWVAGAPHTKFSRRIRKMDEASTYSMAHEFRARSVLLIPDDATEVASPYETPLILSTLRARIIFGFAVLLAASAGLGVLSSQWDESAEKQEFPAMRGPVQHKTPSRHDATQQPASPARESGQDTGKTGAA